MIKPKPIWLDIEYTGKTAITDLKSQIEDHLTNYPHLVALTIKDKSLTQTQYQKIQSNLKVRELDPYHVFAELLADKVEDKDKSSLSTAYQVLLKEIAEDGKQAL